jgi:hypothetical protein
MSVDLWVAEFKALHERGRKGQLSEDDKRLYLSAREKFARALVASQGIQVPEGQSARRYFRIAQGMQVDLNFTQGNVRAMTQEVSCTGFSVLLHQPPQESSPGFSLRLPGGVEPLIGRVKVLSSTRRVGNHQLSFTFVDLPEREQERLETALFDLALARIK